MLCASLASRCPRSRLSRARPRRARLPAAPRASPCSCSSPSRRPRPRPAPLSSSPTPPASTASSPKTSASTSSSPSGSSSTTMTSKCQVSLHTTRHAPTTCKQTAQPTDPSWEPGGDFVDASAKSGDIGRIHLLVFGQFL